MVSRNLSSAKNRKPLYNDKNINNIKTFDKNQLSPSKNTIGRISAGSFKREKPVVETRNWSSKERMHSSTKNNFNDLLKNDRKKSPFKKEISKNQGNFISKEYKPETFTRNQSTNTRKPVNNFKKYNDSNFNKNLNSISKIQQSAIKREIAKTNIGNFNKEKPVKLTKNFSPKNQKLTNKNELKTKDGKELSSIRIETKNSLGIEISNNSSSEKIVTFNKNLSPENKFQNLNDFMRSNNKDNKKISSPSNKNFILSKNDRAKKSISNFNKERPQSANLNNTKRKPIKSIDVKFSSKKIKLSPSKKKDKNVIEEKDNLREKVEKSNNLDVSYDNVRSSVNNPASDLKNSKLQPKKSGQEQKVNSFRTKSANVANRFNNNDEKIGDLNKQKMPNVIDDNKIINFVDKKIKSIKRHFSPKAITKSPNITTFNPSNKTKIKNISKEKILKLNDLRKKQPNSPNKLETSNYSLKSKMSYIEEKSIKTSEEKDNEEEKTESLKKPLLIRNDKKIIKNKNKENSHTSNFNLSLGKKQMPINILNKNEKINIINLNKQSEKATTNLNKEDFKNRDMRISKEKVLNSDKNTNKNAIHSQNDFLKEGKKTKALEVLKPGSNSRVMTNNKSETKSIDNLDSKMKSSEISKSRENSISSRSSYETKNNKKKKINNENNSGNKVKNDIYEREEKMEKLEKLQAETPFLGLINKSIVKEKLDIKKKN